MYIPKKTIKRLAGAINSASVWSDSVSRSIEQKQYEDAIQAMKWHDEAVKEIRSILGVETLALFNKEV